MKKKNIAGMSMKGGKKDNFFFCLLEYFPNKDRWFLNSLLKVKDRPEKSAGDEVIGKWIEEFELNKLVVDFPLSYPECYTCKLDCPGLHLCPQESIVEVRKRLEDLLKCDEEIYNKDPKQYERERNRLDEYDHSRIGEDLPTTEHILSRQFKKKLKKGILPYWNRALDFWIWCLYHDLMLDLFKGTYDSFGNASLMTLSRFKYLERHFPKKFQLFEGNTQVILMELLRSKIIERNDILNLRAFEEEVSGRIDVIKKIEEKCKIFIYQKDLESLVESPRAFESFLLALSGQRILLDKIKELPEWVNPEKVKFVIPSFS